MANEREALDQQILLICEDIEQCLKRAELLPDYNDSSSYYCRLVTLKEKVATERRLQEELSLPCRFLLEHFSLFWGNGTIPSAANMGRCSGDGACCRI